MKLTDEALARSGAGEPIFLEPGHEQEWWVSDEEVRTDWLVPVVPSRVVQSALEPAPRSETTHHQAA